MLSVVKFKEECVEFKTSKKEVAAWRLGMIAIMSSMVGNCLGPDPLPGLILVIYWMVSHDSDQAM